MWLACNETVTPGEHFTKNKNMQKWMVEFLRNLRVVAMKLLELTQFAYGDVGIPFILHTQPMVEVLVEY